MTDFSYLARQAILNEDQDVVAYELLYRNSANNVFPMVPENEATSKVIEHSFFHMGIEQVAGACPCFVNFPRQALLDMIPCLISPQQIVIELLENLEPNVQLLETVEQLHTKGYLFALDDFLYSEQWEPFFKFISFVKFDIQISSTQEISDTIEHLQSYPIQFLAEKVEDYTQFEQMKLLGCTLFQGYFFCRPQMFRKPQLSSSQVSALALLAEVYRSDTSPAKLHSIISKDLSISYKLLKYVNTLIYSNAKPVSSFSQAISFLGQQKLQRFASLVAMASAAQDKPRELFSMALVRANFCESMAKASKKADPDHAFLTGLFSLMPTILDQDMSVILSEIGVANEVNDALMTRRGTLALYLSLIIDLEKASWPTLQTKSVRFGLDEKVISEYYFNALSDAQFQHACLR
ncbi:HDOD domain-containing protein [Alginatibacterium sediminis]|uniref:HDOD domain-containing protein n=1 Tax=Alginatibacterium sediminis TaxID=2164068 RepID=A0A420EG31_9ALTE|nr:HDOD domain-containing protein [Alginatibacterium sediminis]RKF19665.1 HDOD domain-containing protein [Alginatibacterium sediminis]